MSTPTLSSDLSKRIVDKMCISAAAAVKLQCGKEYGFSDTEKRETDLSTLAANELKGLPTNNFICQGLTEKHKMQKVGIDGSRLRIFETIWYCIKQKVK